MNEIFNFNEDDTENFVKYLEKIKENLLDLEHVPALSQSMCGTINDFFRSRKIDLVLVTQDCETIHETWSYSMTAIAREDISVFLPLLTLELALYPKDFFSKIGLKQIIVCNSLVFKTSSAEHRRAAIPDYEPEVMGMIYCATISEFSYSRGVIHHELYHFFEKALFGTAYKKDDEWDKLNPKDFEYGDEGVYKRKSEKKKKDHLKDYFVSDFSKSSVEEDRAEIFSWLARGNNIKEYGEGTSVHKKCLKVKEILKGFDSENFEEGENNFWGKALRYRNNISKQYYPDDDY